MTQIALLKGIYADSAGDFRTALPRNMVPVPKPQGISEGYLRPAEGIVALGEGPGVARGAVVWRGNCYRVLGTKLCRVLNNGTVVEIGDVGGTGNCRLDYSFDYLAISSSGALYLWDETTLTQVTDTDLGTVVDFVWIDGYFISTDGEFLVQPELTDPTSVNPLKYGSAEVDPDGIKATLKVNNELHALNRFTTEVYQNIGGDFFAFQRIPGAMVSRGTIGTRTCCEFLGSVAFIGSGRNEPPAVWLGAGGDSVKISTREIDTLLQTHSEGVLASCLMETRVDKGHQHLLMHLPDRTLVYDAAASKELQDPVWFDIATCTHGDEQYRARDLQWFGGRWTVADPQSGAVGYLTDTLSTHWGEAIGWNFGTMILYNEGRGAIFHELELVALTGRVALGVDPTIWTSYSLDGVTWSDEKPVRAGTTGNRTKRLVWLSQGGMQHWRIQRFRGTSDAHLSFPRLEARIEGLAA